MVQNLNFFLTVILSSKTRDNFSLLHIYDWAYFRVW